CGDTLEVVVGSQVSLNETGLAHAVLYPNPTNEKVYLSFGFVGIKEGLIEVYSLDGKCMLVQALNDLLEQEISLGDLAVGMYRIKVICNQKIAQWSVVKQ
ncbi:MAG: T9SS type A sorting domain-containing protein, partial [Bacteroidota bacterium]